MPTILAPDYRITGPRAGYLAPSGGTRNPGFIYDNYTPPPVEEPAPAGEPTPGTPAGTGAKTGAPPEYIPATPPGTGVSATVGPAPTTGAPAPTPSSRLFDLAHLPREVGPSHAGAITGSITGLLMGQDPFPSELVPPFSIEPGLVQDSGFASSLLDPNNAGFMMAQAQQAQAQQAQAQQAQASQATAGQANVNLDNFNATTRSVTPNELVSNQLNQLLAEESAYMENAAVRGRELASSRGALSSSMFAGAAQRSAIEAGLPIATADAQAYIQAASQNMAAQNQMTLAKLDSATQQAITNAQLQTQTSISNAQMATDTSQFNAGLMTQNNQFNANLGTEVSLANAQLGTQASIANTNASTSLNTARLSFQSQRMLTESRERIAETQLNAAFTSQMFNQNHQAFMERLSQSGRIDMTMLSGNIQAQLQERGFTHDMNIANLSQAQRLEFERIIGQPRFESQLAFNQAQLQAQTGTNIISNYASIMQSANGLDIDDPARARLQEFGLNYMESAFGWLSSVGQANNWPEFNFDFGNFELGG